MEKIDILDSNGTDKSLPINLIVSSDIISVLFFDNRFTQSVNILLVESNLSFSGQHFM